MLRIKALKNFYIEEDDGTTTHYKKNKEYVVKTKRARHFQRQGLCRIYGDWI